MGLDQYAFVTKETVKELNNDKREDKRDLTKIWYGRKINPLQGYFENKHNIDNCQFLEIHEKDIKEIRQYAEKSMDVAHRYITDTDKEYIYNYLHDKCEYDEERINIIDDRMSEIYEDELLMKPTQGFFYGNYEINTWYYKNLLEIIDFCNKLENNFMHLNKDERIVYYSWY